VLCSVNTETQQQAFENHVMQSWMTGLFLASKPNICYNFYVQISETPSERKNVT